MVCAGGANLEGDFRIANAPAHATACFMQINFAGDNMRWLGRAHLIRAEAANIFNVLGLGQFNKQVDMRVIGGNDNCAARNRIPGHIICHIVKNLALGAGNISFGVKMFDMRRADMRDNRALRFHHADQRINLTGMVHTDFENAIGAILRHARKAQRHADMIVEGFFRSESFSRFR